jgi:hypothetical protein
MGELKECRIPEDHGKHVHLDLFSVQDHHAAKPELKELNLTNNQSSLWLLMMSSPQSCPADSSQSTSHLYNLFCVG